MSRKLEGKIALVTGGAGGIGRATALAYMREGAKVAVADLDGAAARDVADEIVAAGGEALGLAADVSLSEDVEAMVAQVVARFGRLDIAFNNAGIEVEHEPLHKTDEAMFDHLMNVNVKGVWLCMKHEITQMLRQGHGGAIVNTASVGGLIGAPRQPIYGATKHAVVGMTKSAGLEYGRKGIRVNAVCPGIIRTEMTERAIAREPRRQQYIDQAHPIGRLGEADEIARAVVFLSSDDAAFVLGHPLAVDGGYTAR
ncbi:SDR family oxidoreductase [Piscinibacter gummiphilus]|uniref:Short-chain dehydrogenase n=1 Tax=Piscinibacter gummiphilus TaxID=946333 RepID=A0A1W6L4G9_9BURK|nr:SDR family oxidoreductase [Piscinibacter gummiphilus]ARN19134.1 short-chain dehydrogenase [Piscinibacter gummiphilus]ATU63788.1 short chain dehydrogenase [Piscinibacter gummiphilus]GLS93273.1 short chain dehydrogenase [Piscinibacter gummiphilus]